MASDGISFGTRTIEAGNWSKLLYFSTSTLVSLGCEVGTPTNASSLWIVIIIRVFGSLLNLVFLGVIMSKFAMPPRKVGVVCHKIIAVAKTNILDQVVLSRRCTLNMGPGGNPVLTFRIGSIEGEKIICPDIRLTVIFNDKAESRFEPCKGPNGQLIQGMWPSAACKVLHDRQHSALPPSYYICHVIDRESPLRSDSNNSKVIDLKLVHSLSLAVVGFCNISEVRSLMISLLSMLRASRFSTSL